MAKWVTGDKGFYPARITSITGSSADPIYIVRFKSYDTTEQLRSRDMRPVAQKRKADSTPTTGATPFSAPPQPSVASTSTASASTSSNTGVISAAASIDLELAQKSREAALGNAGEAKPKAKKIKATKELEAGKSKWQEFNTKSKFAKTQKNKKDSMFRTPEGVHGRGSLFSRALFFLYSFLLLSSNDILMMLSSCSWVYRFRTGYAEGSHEKPSHLPGQRRPRLMLPAGGEFKSHAKKSVAT